MQTILDWLLNETAGRFSVSQEDLRHDCQEILTVQNVDQSDYFQTVLDREGLLARLDRWQRDKEYLASLDLHIVIAHHLRSSCRASGYRDDLDSWKVTDVQMDGNTLVSDIIGLIKGKLQTQEPVYDSTDIGQKVHTELILSPLEDFHNGLESRIGYPSLNTDPVMAMKMEHEQERFQDSRGRDVDPRMEWNIVIGSEEWGKGEPPFGIPAIKGRVIAPDLNLDHFVRKAEMDPRISAANLNRTEIAALRLWTGPMHEKYAESIRIGSVEYVNTTHAINSGITKLARIWKLPVDRKVYRGYHKLKMMDLERDACGCVGGVDRCFLATSESRDVAVSYSSDGAFILEMHVGQINRGADISWLSQFPHEKEILFNAMSNVEFLGSPKLCFVDGSTLVEGRKWKGKLKVYDVQINSNVKSKTLDEFVRIRKDLHLNMADVLVKQAIRMMDDIDRSSAALLSFSTAENGGVWFRRHVGAEEDVRVVGRRGLCLDFLRFASVRAEVHCPRGCRALYEVEILVPGNSPQFGFCSGDWARVDERSSLGVGDDSKSWGVDGVRLLKWHNGQNPWQATEWKQRDVIGLACEIDADGGGRILAAVNGGWDAPSALAFHLAPGTVQCLHPAISGDTTRVQCNLGGSPWRYGPPVGRGKFASFGTLSVQKDSNARPAGIREPQPITASPAQAAEAFLVFTLDVCTQAPPATGLVPSVPPKRVSHPFINKLCLECSKHSATILSNGVIADERIFNEGRKEYADLVQEVIMFQSRCREILDLAFGWLEDGTVASDSLDELENWQLHSLRVAIKESDAASCDVLTVEAQIHYFPNGIFQIQKIDLGLIHAPDTALAVGKLLSLSPALLFLRLKIDGPSAQLWKGLLQLFVHREGAGEDDCFEASGLEYAASNLKKLELGHEGGWLIWGAEQKAQLTGHTDWVTAVAWSPDGSKFASGSLDSTIIIWDAQTLKKKAQLENNAGSVFSVAWSPSGSDIVAGMHWGLQVWNVQTGSKKAWTGVRGAAMPCISCFLRHCSQFQFCPRVRSVVWSPDESQIASGTDEPNTVFIWDSQTANPILKLKGNMLADLCCLGIEVKSVAWSPNGSYIASNHGIIKTISVWDVRTGQSLKTLDSNTSRPDIFDSPALPLLSADERPPCNPESFVGHCISCWRRTGKNGHTDFVTSVTWSPDGFEIASGANDNTIIIWNLLTGKQRAQLTGHTDSVNSVAWSPDGTEIASGSSDKTVIVWNAQSGEEKTRLIGHLAAVNSVAWSPEGSNIISGSSDKTILLWDPRNTLISPEGGDPEQKKQPIGSQSHRDRLSVGENQFREEDMAGVFNALTM